MQFAQLVQLAVIILASLGIGALAMLWAAPRLWPERMRNRAEDVLRERDRRAGIVSGAYPPSRPTPRKR